MPSSGPAWYSGSSKPTIWFDSSNIRGQSASGMPIISQIISSGSRAAMSSTKSHSPLSTTSSTMRAARRSIESSSAWIVRGVKPRLTRRR